MTTREGIPYTVNEAKLAAERNAMDPYHRDLILFLVAEVAAEREACARVAEGFHDWTRGVPAPPRTAGECIADAIRERGKS